MPGYVCLDEGWGHAGERWWVDEKSLDEDHYLAGREGRTRTKGLVHSLRHFYKVFCYFPSDLKTRCDWVISGPKGAAVSAYLSFITKPQFLPAYLGAPNMHVMGWLIPRLCSLHPKPFWSDR